MMKIKTEQYYKIYVGKYEKDQKGLCSAPTIYSSIPFKHLSKTIMEMMKFVRNGMDIYIKKPNGDCYAYYRDLQSLPQEERKKLLS